MSYVQFIVLLYYFIEEEEEEEEFKKHIRLNSATGTSLEQVSPEATEDALPEVEFTYLAFIPVPGASYQRKRLKVRSAVVFA